MLAFLGMWVSRNNADKHIDMCFDFLAKSEVPPLMRSLHYVVFSFTDKCHEIFLVVFGG